MKPDATHDFCGAPTGAPTREPHTGLPSPGANTATVTLHTPSCRATHLVVASARKPATHATENRADAVGVLGRKNCQPPLPQIPPQSSPKSFVERAPSSLTRLFLTVAPTVTNEIGHAAASAAGYGSSCRSSLDMGTLGRRAAANRLLAPRPARAANSQRLVGERQRSANESLIGDTF